MICQITRVCGLKGSYCSNTCLCQLYLIKICLLISFGVVTDRSNNHDDARCRGHRSEISPVLERDVPPRLGSLDDKSVREDGRGYLPGYTQYVIATQIDRLSLRTCKDCLAWAHYATRLRSSRRAKRPSRVDGSARRARTRPSAAGRCTHAEIDDSRAIFSLATSCS